MFPLEVIEGKGYEEFSAAIIHQQSLVEDKIENRSLPDYLVLVEHHPVYTLGRGEKPQLPAITSHRKIPWIETNRGGKATFHGPGQITAYPIFDLERHGADVHLYLRRLEEVIILTLSKFEIKGRQRDGLSGVWVESNTREGVAERSWKKIASLGIGVRRWISFHGLALNVNCDLSFFEAISPCGENGRDMTSMQVLLGQDVSLDRVKFELVDSFSQVFNLNTSYRSHRPSWLRVKSSDYQTRGETGDILKRYQLNTVCQEANCPNIGECWSQRTATFMIMGEHCTRRCRFCSVKDGSPQTLLPLDPLEPQRIGAAVNELGLRHVVVTSVNRDDLFDMGAEHFAKTARAIKEQNKQCTVELLIPDLQGKIALLWTICSRSGVDILGHNVETVPRLYPTVRPGADFERSLDILRWTKEISKQILTKSGLMLGLGETKEEVLEVIEQLRAAGVDMLTLGQYLQPTAKQLPVQRFVTPAEFDEYRETALKVGFKNVQSGPLIRSSYHAAESCQNSISSQGV